MRMRSIIMTKITKSEKLLREATSKWNKFLNEGAFKQVNENNPPKAADGYYIHLKRTPLRVVSGSLKGAEGKAVEFTTTTKGEPAIVIELTKNADQRVFGQVSDEVIVLPGDVETIGTDMADDPKMDRFNDMPSRDGEVEEGMGGESGEDWDDLLSQIMNASPDADAAEMAERAADLVDAGNIDAATDLIADIINNTSDPDTSETAEKAYDAVEALQMNEGGTMGEYGKIDAEDGNPPSKIGRGNEEYMAAYNAVLQARGEEPLDIQKPDQAYLDALRSGQLQETVRKIVAKVLSEKKNFRVGEIDEKLSAADKEFHKSVMDKGKVPNLKGDMGPLPGMEGPFQFRSGAVLYYDPKEGAYYDRGKDMYLDREEAAELTMENVKGGDGLENARQLIAFARKRIDDDLDFEYELKANNRIDWEDIVKSLSRAERLILEHQDEMKGLKEDSLEEDASDQTYDMLDTVVDGLGGEKQALDSIVQALDVLTIQELLRKIIRSYGLNSELAEADRTTVSADPEMDQIEDIALSVIEKFGGLMGIASKLKDQGFDASVANGALSIDGKYFMGKADNFDISPDEDVRKVGKYVLGYMG